MIKEKLTNFFYKLIFTGRDVITNFIDKLIKKFLRFLLLFCLLLFIYNLASIFTANKRSEKMEQTIQHAVDMKPLVFESIAAIDPTAIMQENDLIFRYSRSVAIIERGRSGLENRSGIYYYVQRNGRRRYFVHWEIGINDGYIITSIIVK